MPLLLIHCIQLQSNAGNWEYFLTTLHLKTKYAAITRTTQHNDYGSQTPRGAFAIHIVARTSYLERAPPQEALRSPCFVTPFDHQINWQASSIDSFFGQHKCRIPVCVSHAYFSTTRQCSNHRSLHHDRAAAGVPHLGICTMVPAPQNIQELISTKRWDKSDFSGIGVDS